MVQHAPADQKNDFPLKEELKLLMNYMEETYPSVGFTHKWQAFMDNFDKEEEIVKKLLAKRG